MATDVNSKIRIKKYKIFDQFEVDHGVYTRSGGVSQSPWDSLNFGGTVGDDPINVTSNHELAFRAAGLSRMELFDAWQVHGTDILAPDGPRLPGVPHQKADILITNKPGLVLFMRFADCVPILLYDPKKHACGLVHAGWQGTVKKAAFIAISAMKDLYRSSPADIRAVIGPSIGPDHYQVGSNVAEQVVTNFRTNIDEILISKNGHQYFDLWKANQIILEQSGVELIETAYVCTYCHDQDWFSHRRDKGRTGRFGTFLRLTDK
jgi:polyphenol oxidase